MSSSDDGTNHVLRVLYLGTGISFFGAVIILATYHQTPELHGKRALTHIGLKSCAVITLALGYWLNLVLPTDCYNKSFCAIQFVLLQVGNVGIIASEFAMTLEVFYLTRHFQRDTLSQIIDKTPIEIKISYAVFALLAFTSVAAGLVMYLNDQDTGLQCYLGSWCWYLDPWAIFAFKFGWIALVVLFGTSTIFYLQNVTSKYAGRATVLQATKSLSSMLRNLLICHILSWGLTFVWRVYRSQDSPPEWATDPYSPVIFFVVLNGAGAGYLDLMIWLSFPQIYRKYIEPHVGRCKHLCGRNETDAASTITREESNFQKYIQEDAESSVGNNAVQLA